LRPDRQVAGEAELIAAPARRAADETAAAEVKRGAGVQLRAGVVAPVGARLAAARLRQRQLVILGDAEVKLSQLPAADQRSLRVAFGAVGACFEVRRVAPG